VNRLSLNAAKCLKITFSRLKNTLINDYSINNHLLREVSVVKDLGVTLDSKLIMDVHIENIVKKALKNLGFLNRVTKEFRSEKCLKLLYNSLVRSHLEYACVVWNPQYIKYIERIESVQKKFVNILNFRCHRNQHFQNYDMNLKKYDLHKLTTRRNVAFVTFLYKLLTGQVSCNLLISKLNFNVGYRSLRSPSLFYISKYNTSSSGNSPLNSLQKIYNHFFAHIDIFNISLLSLKSAAYQVFT
jgi:hypothetical protein